MSQPMSAPNPMHFFETVNAHQRTEALKAAIELNLFTAIATGAATPEEIASACAAAPRGTRILCDYLTILGFLAKQDGRYSLTPDSAFFLDRRSPAYIGGAVEFLLSPMLSEAFKRLTEAVRNGGTVLDAEGTIAPEHPIWVRFAQAMAPLMTVPAQAIAQLVPVPAGRPIRILDIAAGHGMFGIAFARQYPNVEVVAVDWPNVLEVARGNAAAAAVSDRYRMIPGSAFEVDFGTGYDLALLTNFLHHFDVETCERLIAKVGAALNADGRAVTLEFIPNEDRISPPHMAAFSLVMLVSTPSGDAYTFSEFEGMFGRAGFASSEMHELQPMARVVISKK